MIFQKKDMTITKGEKIFTNIDEIDKIFIKEIATDILFLPTEKQELKIIYQENKIEKYDISFENNVVLVKKLVPEKKIKFTYDKLTRLIVYIPKKMNISIENISSNVDVRIKEVKKLHIETVSGFIKTKNLVADKLFIDSVSGSIELIPFKADNIEIKTVSTNVILGIDDIEQNYNIHSEKVLKNIFIKQNTDKHIDLKTISGTFKLEFLRSKMDIKK